MNESITYADLAPMEREVADLYAWGMTKKEIAQHRGKSYHTIDMQIRRLFQKTGVRKETEFGAWYFCTRFKISFALSPLQRSAVSLCLLLLLIVGSLDDGNPFIRVRARASRSVSARASRGARRTREDFDFNQII